MYVSCHIRICSHSWNGNESKSTCSMCVGGPGRLLASPPLLRWRSCWGGREGRRAGSSLGILSREGGISGKHAASWNGRFFWRVNSADYSRGWIRQVATARYFGGSFGRIYLVGHFGAFIWRVFVVTETSKLQNKEKTNKGKIRVYNQQFCKCIMSLYIASIIMLFCSRYRFCWTS